MCSTFQPQKKACNNRCGSGGCKNKPSARLIIAASGGSICLLEKRENALVAHEEGKPAIASPQAFTDYMAGDNQRQFNQLVLVGSGNDLAWISALLPPELSKCVVAEMTYPLRSEWLHEPGLAQLRNTLTPLMQ